jgi:hypothetical protein
VPRETSERVGFTVIRLLVLAAWTIITSSAQAAALAEQPSSSRRPELSGVAFTASAPQTDPLHDPPESCPYHFDSDMPAGTFCVYRGVALGGGGEVCATDVVVIWSAWQGRASDAPGEKEPPAGREVYLAFVADPEPVVRAIVDSQQRDRAEMVEYTAGSAAAPQPLAGEMTLRAVRRGSADVLSMDLREPRRFHPGICAFVAYSGTFLGVIQPPTETTTYERP